ncbi:MAG: uridine diphosphate-N-acetylglucosamine-binding protein YvcK [Candidatus Magasanikbacteria bacterium]
MKNVVTIGGGNGSSLTLNALKRFVTEINLSAIVSVSDSGGSSGRLREEFGVLPPGDILRCILALSKYDFFVLKQIFNKNRFSTGKKMVGHNLGNLILTLMQNYEGDFVQAIRSLEEVVESQGKVYPITLEKNDLIAELENGDIICGETNIDKPIYNRELKIKKVWLETLDAKKQPKIFNESKEVLLSADYIFFGPGDLFTSIIVNTLVEDFSEIMKLSKAKLIYIFGNAHHTDGETGPTTFSDSVLTLEKYVGKKMDFIIYNNHILNKQEEKKYQERGWELIECDKENLKGHNIVECDYERPGGGLCPDKLANSLEVIMEI